MPRTIRRLVLMRRLALRGLYLLAIACTGPGGDAGTVAPPANVDSRS